MCGRLVVEHGQPHLLEIVLTLHLPCGFPRRLHRRQQKRHEDPDDRDDDQQLNQGKTVAMIVHFSSISSTWL